MSAPKVGYAAAMTTRRELLAGAGAWAFTAALGARAAPTQPADPRLTALLDRTSAALLAEYPDSATFLGLDTGAHAALQGQLPDQSVAGVAARAAACRARVKELRAFDGTRLTGLDAVNLEATRYAHALAADGYDRFPYGDNAVLNTWQAEANTPYAVSQGSGFFAVMPDLLDTLHKVETTANAEAYLQRLDAYARGLDGETERLQRDAGLGVIAPDFLLDTTLKQQVAYAAVPVADWGLVSSLARRTREQAIPGDWETHARKLCETAVAPALARQIETLRTLRAKATHEAGVTKLPDGEAYYRWALQAGTTTTETAEEVHALGLEQVGAISAKMDRLLREQGLTAGTVGQRMSALSSDPRFLFPNDEAGRAQLLAYLNRVIADMRTRLPRAFATLKKADLVIKRVPPSIEAGAPDGYEENGPIDGSAPSIYYINLRDTANWPKFSLPTLCFHEGLPGHVWQGSFVNDLPVIRSQLVFNAYVEGWALYAEQLGDELGAYEHDPFGKLGFLQSIQFRACRLVVDTGLHAKRWSREQAIRWMVDHNGNPVDSATGEIDRYCAWPGQACGYQIGHLQIAALRRQARGSLGRRFDLRSFDDALLTSGSMPLDLLRQVMHQYVQSRRV
jgi:uncharacterized protein (DUF885 family)